MATSSFRIIFLAGALALATTGAQAFARAPAQTSASADVLAAASVEPVSAGHYRISWGAMAAPVDVYVASTADARASQRTLLARGVKGTSTEVATKIEGRPYFFLKPTGGKAVVVAERLLPLEGGRNFRDMGGYTTADGRTVRWGKVFRSGAMARLTPADQDYLVKLGVRQVYDFRTTSEREQEQAVWLQNTPGLDYWTRDYEMSSADLGRLMTSEFTGKDARDAMIALYNKLPYEQQPAYSEMFRSMVAGRTPLAFNCTAGKDRAGLAAALILTALGVPRDTVMADYLLTNRYLPMAYSARTMKDGKSEMESMMSRLSPEAIEAFLGADPEYLRTSFAAIEARNGTIDNYLRDELGLSDEDRAALQARLLSERPLTGSH